jgi:hypothetical protein
MAQVPQKEKNIKGTERSDSTLGARLRLGLLFSRYIYGEWVS